MQRGGLGLGFRVPYPTLKCMYCMAVATTICGVMSSHAYKRYLREYPIRRCVHGVVGVASPNHPYPRLALSLGSCRRAHHSRRSGRGRSADGADEGRDSANAHAGPPGCTPCLLYLSIDLKETNMPNGQKGPPSRDPCLGYLSRISRKEATSATHLQLPIAPERLRPETMGGRCHHRDSCRSADCRTGCILPAPTKSLCRALRHCDHL